MSFQGDVRGIGLAELLQGLARGRKEGLLSLGSAGRSSCLVGLMEGRLILLPDEDEREEELADRIRVAFAHGLEDSVEPEEIEKLGGAQRLEAMYCLLDGGEVHFRFDPGDLAQLDAGIDAGSGTQLEFILLEYARISDELEGLGDLSFLGPHAVPQWVDPARAEGMSPNTVAQIDGRSTVQEIGDRLSIASRQVKLTLANLFQAGALRLSTPEELFALTLQEMEARQFARACQRLRAWVSASAPGPMHPEAARILSDEWLSGRLPASMRGMQAKETRALLRRLDATLGNPSSAVGHWTEAVHIHPDDPICRMHSMSLQYAEDDRSDKPSVRELLGLARKFKEAGTPSRGAPLLLIAVQKKPEGLGQKLEVGLGLLEAGQPEHGGPWVLSAAHSLVDRGQADRALAPLRMLIEAYPQSREGKALLQQARRASTQAKKVRRMMYIGAACLTLLGAAALVKIRSDHKREGHLAEVRALIATPDAALTSLNQHFPNDQSMKVLRLRRRIEDSQRAIEVKQKDAWLDIYKKAQEQAKHQPPIEALEAIRTLPAPPKLMLLKEQWPTAVDLYDLVGKRLTSELGGLGTVQAFSDVQEQMEGQFKEEANSLRAAMTEREVELASEGNLITLLGEFDVKALERSELRDSLESRIKHQENLDEQDRLREQAVTAEENGDFERALHFYEEILAGELDPRIRDYIQPQADTLADIILAIREARELASSGSHTEALALLEKRIENQTHYERTMVPWKVTSYPTGATVTTSAGHTYITPFEIETATIEHLTVTISSPGFSDREILVKRPADLEVFLSRVPETQWSSEGRVDAVPVPYEDDHIVVDRDGALARIQAGNTVVWENQIPTLSGLARAPVFFPGGSEKLLLVTEEGSAWLVSASDGTMEGPWELSSPPRIGPLANSSHVHVMLANGRWAAWKDALQPEMLESGNTPYDPASCASYRYGPNNGMQVLRSREGEFTELKSRFTGWTAKVNKDRLMVTPPIGEGGFSTKIHGRWTFLAWEPGTPTYPEGRLWLSDDYGLRALTPLPMTAKETGEAADSELESPTGSESEASEIRVPELEGSNNGDSANEDAEKDSADATPDVDTSDDATAAEGETSEEDAESPSTGEKTSGNGSLE